MCSTSLIRNLTKGKGGEGETFARSRRRGSEQSVVVVHTHSNVFIIATEVSTLLEKDETRRTERKIVRFHLVLGFRESLNYCSIV